MLFAGITVTVFHEGGPILDGEKWSQKQKRKLLSGSLAARFEDISVLIFALTGILSRRVGVLVHKGEVHQHPERICTKILQKMKLVF